MDNGYVSKAHFLEEAFIGTLNHKTPNVQHSCPDQRYQKICKYTYESASGFIVLGWVNEDSHMYYDEQCDFTTISGATPIQPFRWSTSQGHYDMSVSKKGYKVKVVPGERKMMFIEIELDQPSFSISHAIQTRFGQAFWLAQMMKRVDSRKVSA